jgi:hypothetical protein
VLGYGLDDRGSRVRFPAGAGNFCLHHRVQNGSGAHPASYAMGTGALSLGVKRPGREVDHSPPSDAEFKNAWSYTSTPPNVFMAWCLVKHRDNFNFTFYFPYLVAFPPSATWGRAMPWWQGTHVTWHFFYNRTSEIVLSPSEVCNNKMWYLDTLSYQYHSPLCTVPKLNSRGLGNNLCNSLTFMKWYVCILSFTRKHFHFSF